MVYDNFKNRNLNEHSLGEVTEWLKVPVLKTGVPAMVPRVRIPPSPPGEWYSAFMLGTFLLDEKVDSVLRFEDQACAQEFTLSTCVERIRRIIPPSPPGERWPGDLSGHFILI